ncbi:MAG: molybdenum cofactor guanylyltransferase MobA [Ostreibacterium sp.]
MMNINPTTTPNKIHYTGLLGVVLCGGQGSRMGGADKGLVTFNGNPMACYSINALQHCEQTIINANRHQPIYERTFQLAVISDENHYYDGPLAGMLAAMRYAQQQGLKWIITTPCDAPFITTEYVDTMWQTSQSSDKQILVACDKNKYHQPVFSLLKAELADELANFLQGEQKKILMFYQKIGFKTQRFNQHELFTNINHTGDLI